MSAGEREASLEVLVEEAKRAAVATLREQLRSSDEAERRMAAVALLQLQHRKPDGP